MHVYGLREATEKDGPWVDAWAWEDIAYDFQAGCKDIRITFVPEILCYTRCNYGEEQLSKTKYLNRALSNAPLQF